MLSRFMRLFCHPSTLILTNVEDGGCGFVKEEVAGGISGIGFAPAETLTVKNSEPATETPTEANGDVVCSPRLIDKSLRFFTLILNPEPALQFGIIGVRMLK